MTENSELPESDEAPDVTEPVLKKKSSPAVVADPQVIEDEEPDPDEQAREEAFVEDEEWNGCQLKPWSFCRESVFYSLRTSMGAPPIDAMNADLTSFLADAARILWLCSTDESDIQRHRSRPAFMQQLIDAWANEAIPGKESDAATLLALKIHNRAALNRPIPVEDGSPAGN